MNRFTIATTPEQCAQDMPDKHVVKMILEEAQMLYTALHLNGFDFEDGYKPTHKHHPCTVWTAESAANYGYGLELLEAMGKEYTHRYGKVHATIIKHLDKLQEYQQLMPNQGWSITDWQFAGSADTQRFDSLTDCIDRYRRYYRETKQHIARWTNRQQPEWWTV